MVTFARIPQWVGVLVCAAALSIGAAAAQSTARATPRPAPPPATSGTATQTAEAAAAEAAKRNGTRPAGTQDFLLDEALRAERIRKAAQEQPDEAAFYRQDAAVERARKEQADWVRQQHARATQIAGAAQAEGERMAGLEENRPKRPQYLVFVSQSMGQAALKAAFEYGRGKPEVGFVFRGFLPGQSPMQFHAALAAHQGRTAEEMVLVMLDPPAFRDHKITAVPAIVRLDEHEKLVAKVVGLVNPGWVREQVASGRQGDLGTQGQTYRIGELDLIEQMKAKAATLDLAKQGEDARRRFFLEMPTIDLPYAREKRIRTLVPQVVVNEDVVDQTGRVRYRRGQAVSMQEHLQAAPVLVIFNSQDPVHVAFAKQMIARTPPNKQVILMTTRVDRAGGIPKYARQEVAIGRPVYLLMEDVRTTFGIEHVPTVVTPTEKEFVVVEVPLTQGVSDGNAGR